ncbi:hypothetical protein [Bacillus sp. EB600]|uniref:hypothetical protein n=1 Tax=Bacillus sp. EB600 TaxID=2806345 RepID=UPI00210EC8B9|nr:hypothetical protein [Bacillus sp. EB600]MCQ6278150.1 hypothetical protein [Bacillus sp. EB600]
METILIAIIVGVISAIYTQSKKKGKESGAGRPFFSNWLRSQEKVKSQRASTAGKHASPVQQRSIQSHQRAGRSASLNSTSQDKDVLQRGIEFLEIEDQLYPIEAPEQKTLVNAIIWSEVLGPPRSKSPHFTRKG